jgi:hypothetical protein
MTNDPSFDDPRLARYLLGEAPPDEQASIEQRYCADPDFHAEVQAVERELIDQYIRGELTNTAAFETHFMAAPSRREKVEFARALMRTPVSQPAASASGTRRLWPLAAAATLVLAAGSAWLLTNRPSVEPEQANAGVETPAGGGAVPVKPSIAPPTPAPPRPLDPAPRVVTLMLTPTLVRSSGTTPALVVGDATHVRLQLAIEGDTYSNYRVLIRTAEGVEIWRQEQLKAQAVNGERAIVIDVPAARFSTNDFTVTLSGITSGGGVDELDGYSFRAQTRP